MRDLKVTVITVCFNSVKTLQKAIESVLTQTYRHIEYIIVDGGSTDGTIDLIKAHERSIDRWVSEPDRGLYDAMNKGIRQASGDLIGLLNSDDWYAPDTVEKAARRFMESSADLVHGNAAVAFDESPFTYCIAPSGALENLHFHMTMNHGSVFVKKEIYLKYGLFDIHYQIAADYELMLRFFTAGLKFSYLAETMVYFRTGGLSSERKLWRVAVEERNIGLRYLDRAGSGDKEKYRKLILENYKTAKKKAVFRFLDRRARGQIGRACLSAALGSKTDFIILGAGLVGVQICEWIRGNGFRVNCFVDNSIEKQKCFIGDLEILSPGLLKGTADKAVVIVAITYDREEIERQLESYQLRRGMDYLFFDDLYDWIIENYRMHCSMRITRAERRMT